MKLCAIFLAGGLALDLAALVVANPERNQFQCPGVCLGGGAARHHEDFAPVEENKVEVDIKEIDEEIVKVELREKRGSGCGAKCEGEGRGGCECGRCMGGFCGFGPQEPVESDLIPKDVGLSACGQPCKTVSDCHPLCHNAQCVSGKCSPTKRPIHPVTARLEERQYSGDGNKLCTTQADCKGVPFTHCLGGECVPRCSAEDEDCVGEVSAIEERASDLLYRQCKVESDCADSPHTHCDKGWCRMWCLTGDEDCVQGKVAKVEEVKTIAEPGVCVVPCWTNTDCDGCGGGRCFRGRCLRNGLSAEPSVDVAEDMTTKREEDVVDASTCQSCSNNENCIPCSPFLHCRLGHYMIQRKARYLEAKLPAEVKRSGCGEPCSTRADCANCGNGFCTFGRCVRPRI